MTAKPRVLDPCCGSRMMWFDRQHPDVVFGDRRSETLTVTDRSHGNESGTRTLRIEPDALLDFRALPYPDGSFKLVAFDPPHLERAVPRVRDIIEGAIKEHCGGGDLWLCADLAARKVLTPNVELTGADRRPA